MRACPRFEVFSEPGVDCLTTAMASIARTLRVFSTMRFNCSLPSCPWKRSLPCCPRWYESTTRDAPAPCSPLTAAAAVTCGIMKPGIQARRHEPGMAVNLPLSAGFTRRSILRSMMPASALNTMPRNPGKRQRLTVKVSPRPPRLEFLASVMKTRDCLRGIRSISEHFAAVRQRIAHRAVHTCGMQRSE